MSDGAFGPDNRFEFEVETAIGFNGEDWSGSDIEEHLEDIDQIFYRVTDIITGEEFYRWVAGPFEDLESAAEIIAEQESSYVDVVK